MDFAGTPLFSDVSFDVWPKERLGLIGANGTGKTTMFRLITAQQEPTGGGIARGKGVSLGYLEQHACAGSERCVYEELLRVFEPLMRLEAELAEIALEIERNASRTAQPEMEQLLERQSALQAELERKDGLTYRSRGRAALLGLGFQEAEFSQSCGSLSGGQRSKLGLGKLLLSGADLLLLDEPTNHLDIPSVEWLEGFLQSYRGAYIAVSHDRYFLDKVTEKTLLLSHGRLSQWEGSYSAFLQKKAEHDALLQRHYENDMREVRRIEGIIEQQRRWGRERNFITAESKRKMLEKKLAQVEAPESAEKTLRFRFEPEAVSGNEVLMASGLAKSFGGKRPFRDLSLQIFKQDRVFLLGPNGCGKTTLLRILSGEQPADSGSFTYGAKVRPGYFDQSLEGLHPEKTALNEVWDDYPGLSEGTIRGAMALFLFSKDEVFKRVSALSGGEKAKLALLKLLLSGANFLLLDEPTNHLDMPSREALESALLEFPGTILAVSHDRYFIKKLSTKILQMQPDGLRQFLYGYEDYAETLAREAAAQPKAEKPQKENAYKQRREREGEWRRLKGKLTRCEAAIAALEEQNASRQEEMNRPDTAADYEKLLALTEEMEQLRQEQERLLEDWETLHLQYDALTAELTM